MPAPVSIFFRNPKKKLFFAQKLRARFQEEHALPMKTPTNNSIAKVVVGAIDLIDQAKLDDERFLISDIQEIYDANCDRQQELSRFEYALACTLAIGAVREQDGSNIVASAAIADLSYTLEAIEDGFFSENPLRVTGLNYTDGDQLV